MHIVDSGKSIQREIRRMTVGKRNAVRRRVLVTERIKERQTMTSGGGKKEAENEDVLRQESGREIKRCRRSSVVESACLRCART